MFRNLVQAIGVLMISLLVVVCNPMSAPDPVSLQLSWYHEAEFVGYYMAEAQGFYADENISDIHKPQDLVGRRVAVKSASWRQVIHETLINAGIDPAEIVEVEVEYDAMEMLYAGAVDVWTGYVHG